MIVDRTLNWEEVRNTPGADRVFARLEFALSSMAALIKMDYWIPEANAVAVDLTTAWRKSLAEIYVQAGKDLLSLGITKLPDRPHWPHVSSFTYLHYVFTSVLSVTYQWSDYEEEWTVYAEWF